MMNENGQSILEVLIALMLMILFLSGIAVVELYAIKNVEYSQKKSTAVNLARQQLERARVIRDSAGLSSLYADCDNTCYINSDLTPIPLTPTGSFGQSLTITADTRHECYPDIKVTPTPEMYKAIVKVNWSGNVAVTPNPEVEMSSCLLK